MSIEKDIRSASTLPGAYYRDPERFNEQANAVFSKTWHWVGTEADLPKPGSVAPVDLYEGFLSEPLMLTRDQEGDIRCLSNVCTHRANILVKHPNHNCRGITCDYHGRRFKLNGQFESMPEFQDALNFPCEDDNLTQLPLVNWHGHLFTSLDPSFDFEAVSQAVEEKVGFLPIRDFKYDPVASKDYLVKANWALYCDNYLEGFHIPFVHPGLNAVLDYGDYETELYDYCNVQVGMADSDTEVFDLPKNHPDHGKNVAAYYFWVFPNLMLNFYPWGLSINIVRPLAIDRCKVSFLSFVYDESLVSDSAGAELDKVEREDEAVVEAVQRGVRSRFYKQGRFSPTREQGVHHFHSLLSRFHNTSE